MAYRTLDDRKGKPTTSAGSAGRRPRAATRPRKPQKSQRPKTRDQKPPAAPRRLLDVTQRKRAEDAQREQLAQIDAIYQTAPLGLCLLDTEFRYVRVNEALAALNGVPVEQHIGRSVRDVVPHLASTTEAICRRVVATGQPVVNVELTGETAAQPGRARTWATHWSPVKLPDGRLIGVNVIVQDITERKQVEAEIRQLNETLERRVQERTLQLEMANEARREQDARLRMTVEAAGMVAWEWDLATDRISYSENVAAVARGEETASYCSVTTLLQQLHPDDRETLARAVDRTRAEGCPFECEYRVRMLDGIYHWILGQGRLVVVVEGRPVKVMGISQDITARKDAEIQLCLQRDLARYLSQTWDLSAALDRLMEAALHIPGVDCGGVYLRDPETGEFALKVHRGL